MRKVPPPELERGRLRGGRLASDISYGMRGAFLINGPCNAQLRVLSSGAWDNMDWEHVSVSLTNRCPNWPEMCFIKDLFWSDDEVVMQLHPAKKDYVNLHDYCLHLWKPTVLEIPLPPRIMVGPG
jgi:hypothetical protein